MTPRYIANTLVSVMGTTAIGRNETLGDRLRRVRKAVGYSARGLSALAGLSQGHVTLIEKRKGDIESGTAFRLAAVLGISPEWLITGQGPVPLVLLTKSERKRIEAVDAARKGSGESL